MRNILSNQRFLICLIRKFTPSVQMKVILIGRIPKMFLKLSKHTLIVKFLREAWAI